jgi:hypothetical protein
MEILTFDSEAEFLRPISYRYLRRAPLKVEFCISSTSRTATSVYEPLTATIDIFEFSSTASPSTSTSTASYNPRLEPTSLATSPDPPRATTALRAATSSPFERAHAHTLEQPVSSTLGEGLVKVSKGLLEKKRELTREEREEERER